MVDIGDIIPFPGQPGQRPIPGAPSDVTPVEVILVSAPLDREYRNIALNAAAVDAYIAAQVAVERAFPAQVERWSPWSPLQLDIPLEAGVGFNYGRFTIDGRHWYAFLDGEYLNRTSRGNTVRFTPVPDHWTTYGPQIGYSMVERGHIAIAAAQNAGDVYGATYLTAPEPIDAPAVRGVLDSSILGSTPGGWTVLVISANDLNGGEGTPFFASHINSDAIAHAADLASAATIDSAAHVQITVPDALYPWDANDDSGLPDVYVPHINPAPMSTIDGVAAGGGAYLFTPSGFATYMGIMQGAPWVLAGISDIRLVPAWAVSGGAAVGFSSHTPPLDPLDGLWGTAAGIPVYRAVVASSTDSLAVLAGWRASVLAAVGAEGFTKLVTAPFTDILLGNGDGAQTFRPDQWQSDSITVEGVTGAAHGDPTIRLIPTGYNDLGSQLGIDAPVGGRAGVAQSGHGLATSNPATSDNAPYLAAYGSHQNWLGNGMNQNLAITLGLTGIAQNAGVQGIQTVLGALGGAIGGAAGSGAGGGEVGAGAFASLAGSAATLATAQIQAQNAINLLDIAQDGAFDIAAYQLGMSGISSVTAFDAAFQALFSVPGSSVAEHLTSGWRAVIGQAFHAIIAVPSQERVNALVSAWRRYGYMIGQAFVPPRLDPMTHYSYWQLTEPTILGDFPQAARDAISGAFERGATVWGAVAEIGTEPANAPRSGVTY